MIASLSVILICHRQYTSASYERGSSFFARETVIAASQGLYSSDNRRAFLLFYRVIFRSFVKHPEPREPMLREVFRSPSPLHAFCLWQAPQISMSSSSFMVAVLRKPPEPAFSFNVLPSPQSGAIAGPRRLSILNRHRYGPRRWIRIWRTDRASATSLVFCRSDLTYVSCWASFATVACRVCSSYGM